jgi:hypothetical protein
MPPSPGLAIHHHDGVVIAPIHLFYRDKVNVQNFHHGPIFGPADQTVASDQRRLAQAGFDQVGQP